MLSPGAILRELMASSVLKGLVGDPFPLLDWDASKK
jgi:hypothetical protein